LRRGGAVSRPLPPAGTGLETDTAACGAAPPMTATMVVATLVSEPVQSKVAT